MTSDDQAIQAPLAQEDPRDHLRKFGEHQVERYGASAATGSDQLLKTSGWMIGALLAINGGGALATLNAADHLNNPLPPAIAFGVGIALTLLNGVALQALTSLSAQPLEKMIAFWKDVAIRGDYSPEKDAECSRPLTRIGRFSWVPPSFGWLAAVAFFVGGVLLVTDVSHAKLPVASSVVDLAPDRTGQH